MNCDEVLTTTRRAWNCKMTAEEYGALLNELLEAERAGAKLLAVYLDELPCNSAEWKDIRDVQLHEARNCAILIHLLLEAGTTPTLAVGSFYDRGLGIRTWRERIEFLKRGQAWVAKRLAAAIHLIPDRARPMLRTMCDSHFSNIQRCDRIFG